MRNNISKLEFEAKINKLDIDSDFRIETKEEREVYVIRGLKGVRVMLKKCFKIDYFDFHILLTKNKERENSQEIINKLQHLIIYSLVPDNRTYVKCPFCNNLKGFRTIHLMNKDDDLSQLYITLCNRNLKLGNRVILLKNSNIMNP